ncbi:MAG: GIY-YIG nuclease family protein [Burkholderiaceae bacterium]
MSGIYNQTYFRNNPWAKDQDGVLYCVVLVNKLTHERECLKIGIATGKNWKDVLRRSRGFAGYEIRIQKTYRDTIYNCWCLEQALHREYAKYSYKPKQKFGGHTECFELRTEIIQAIPSKK